jgi:pSer/pThr/pTyr-binding forkhead associated (FHA) protein
MFSTIQVLLLQGDEPMDRIGKIFGRKPGQTEPSEENKTGQAPLPAEVNPGSGEKAKDQEFFGLKLILDSGEEFTFTTLPVSIGRSETNQIVLKSETVSGNHAQIYYDELAQEVCILDLDSLNGILVDHAPTRRNILSDGVKISLGDVELTFRDTGYIHNHQGSN